MPGLTNWARTNAFAVFTGSAWAAYSEMWVNLLTTLPTTDGPSAGGDLTAQGAVEWSPARVRVYPSDQGPPDPPYWVVVDDGDTGGIKARNENAIEWDDTATGVIVTSETAKGGAVYNASTGGDMIAFDSFDNDLIVQTSEPVIFSSNKFRIRLHKPQ